jgi:hypothetical protein
MPAPVLGGGRVGALFLASASASARLLGSSIGDEGLASVVGLRVARIGGLWGKDTCLLTAGTFILPTREVALCLGRRDREGRRNRHGQSQKGRGDEHRYALKHAFFFLWLPAVFASSLCSCGEAGRLMSLASKTGVRPPVCGVFSSAT